MKLCSQLKILYKYIRSINNKIVFSVVILIIVVVLALVVIKVDTFEFDVFNYKYYFSIFIKEVLYLLMHFLVEILVRFFRLGKVSYADEYSQAKNESCESCAYTDDMRTIWDKDPDIGHEINEFLMDWWSYKLMIFIFKQDVLDAANMKIFFRLLILIQDRVHKIETKPHIYSEKYLKFNLFCLSNLIHQNTYYDRFPPMTEEQKKLMESVYWGIMYNAADLMDVDDKLLLSDLVDMAVWTIIFIKEKRRNQRTFRYYIRTTYRWISWFFNNYVEISKSPFGGVNISIKFEIKYPFESNQIDEDKEKNKQKDKKQPKES